MKTLSNSLVTLMISRFIHKLQIAKSLLDNKGINSFIFDKNLDLVFGSAFVQGYSLKINANQFNKAKKILEEINEDHES